MVKTPNDPQARVQSSSAPQVVPASRAAAQDSPISAPLLADDGDADSAVSIPPPTLQSLRSSVLEYQEENGRTYHSMSAGKYAFPNDDAELHRLDIQHNMWLLTLRGELGLCPKVRDGANRVLDIGTGTGAWAVEYADLHPAASVVGVDLSPVQPTLVPPNCSFELDDIEKEWTWTKPFDFIFSRVMAGSISDHEEHVKKVYEALEPGGYFEAQDLSFRYECDDGTMNKETSEIYRAGKLSVEGIMERVGFVDVVEQEFKWPLGTWPRDKHHKELGHWFLTNLDVGLEGLLLGLLTRGIGWSQEQVLATCAAIRAEFLSNRVHAYMPVYVVYGRKP